MRTKVLRITLALLVILAPVSAMAAPVEQDAASPAIWLVELWHELVAAVAGDEAAPAEPVPPAVAPDPTSQNNCEGGDCGGDIGGALDPNG